MGLKVEYCVNQEFCFHVDMNVTMWNVYNAKYVFYGQSEIETEVVYSSICLFIALLVWTYMFDVYVLKTYGGAIWANNHVFGLPSLHDRRNLCCHFMEISCF